MSFNALCNAEIERLALLGEELGEVQQIIGKILRHGFETCHPNRPHMTNRDELERELGDVLLASKMMCDLGDLLEENIEGYAQMKKRKVGKYLHSKENICYVNNKQEL